MAKLIRTLVLLSLLGGLAAGCGDQPSAASGQESATADVSTSVVHLGTDLIPASDISKLPEAAKKRSGTFVAGLIEPSGAFTPHFHQSGYDGNVASVLFAPLVTVDKTGLPIPLLAEKWEISSDQLTYTYKLRKGLKFSDGSPLTADDVAFTLTILHDKAYDGGTDIFQTHIKGGQAYKEGKAKKIEGIRVIDPLTIEITTEQVNATALLTLGGMVLSKAYYGKDYAPGHLDYIRGLHAKPVGAGPYKLEKHLPGQEIRFIANEYYFAGKPQVERFIYKTTEGDTFQFLETGEQDFASFAATQDNLEKLQRLGFVNLQLNTSSAYGYIAFNHHKAYLQDKKVRQALIYGLDRKTIVEGVSQGSAQVANVPVSPTSWAYTEEGINPYDYDPDKAKQLLEEAGWKAGAQGIREKDGQKLVIRYLSSKSKNSDAFIAIAKENYEAIGIQFEPEQFADFNALRAKVEGGDYDLASFSTPMIIDPAYGVAHFATEEAEGYSNPAVDKLIQEGLGTLDTEKRKEIYKKLYQELNEDPPYIFYSYSKLLYAYNARIQGLEPNPYRGIATSLPSIRIE
ncbi:MAG: ABC transporter substrate-binding protein [Paenibacillus dendritiformis]|uniref:ABC transporter substrate-binding protein n=1 Tax=uncultured Paenibacillus sp. TaxID=227322 RepID=UPI0025F03375|nr:ABC transporter substrate-binding protein [uncultured Paenibacillus sp.]MDU5142000.1 ABC transporter substrate-binding protein [Paenibacillus dendritiformis]